MAIIGRFKQGELFKITETFFAELGELSTLSQLTSSNEST